MDEDDPALSVDIIFDIGLAVIIIFLIDGEVQSFFPFPYMQLYSSCERRNSPTEA